jgi:hypothetical protein
MQALIGGELSKALERELLERGDRERHARGARSPRTRRPQPR